MSDLPLDEAALDRSEGRINRGDWPADNTMHALVAQSRAALTLRARVAELEAENAEDDALRTRMGDILTLTVNALKGEPDSRSLHDWATLPEVARALVAHAAKLRETLDDIADANGCDVEGCTNRDCLAGKTAKAALASTPATSLAAHDAEVVERLAQRFAADGDEVGVMVAGAIRALAAQEAAQEVKP